MGNWYKKCNNRSAVSQTTLLFGTRMATQTQPDTPRTPALLSSGAPSSTDTPKAHLLFQTLIQAAAKTAPSLSRKSFLRVLQAHGLMEDDHRLLKVMQYIKSSDVELEEKDVEYIRKSSNLVERALNGRLIIPDFVKFTSLLGQMFEETLPDTSGANADYIPQLAKVNPDQFGMAVCTIDGQRFSKGDVSVPFCVQSCSKVITYAIAQTLHGPEKVHQHVGT